jgi:hypothetical protein
VVPGVVESLADGGAISPAQARDQGEKAAGSGAEAKGNKAERAAANTDKGMA